NSTRDQTQLSLRVGNAPFRFEPADQVRSVHEAPRQLVLRRLIWHPQICRPQRKLKTRRQHSNHGVTIAIQRERATDDALIASEPALPKAVSQNRDLWSTLSIFTSMKRAAENRIDAEH